MTQKMVSEPNAQARSTVSYAIRRMSSMVNRLKHCALGLSHGMKT
jgi:hypothetical protein